MFKNPHWTIDYSMVKIERDYMEMEHGYYNAEDTLYFHLSTFKAILVAWLISKFFICEFCKLKSNHIERKLIFIENQFTYDYVNLYIWYFCIRIPVWEGFFSLLHFWKFIFGNSLFKIQFSKLTFIIHFLNSLFEKFTLWKINFLKNSLFEINITELTLQNC